MTRGGDEIAFIEIKVKETVWVKAREDGGWTRVHPSSWRTRNFLHGQSEEGFPKEMRWTVGVRVTVSQTTAKDCLLLRRHLHLPFPLLSHKTSALPLEIACHLGLTEIHLLVKRAQP